MKRARAILVILLAAALLAGCSTKAPQADVTAAPDVQTMEVAMLADVAATPVPEPAFLPVDIPDDVLIPGFYTEVRIPGVEERIFAFIDVLGKLQFRVYGELTVPATSGAPASVVVGFFPVVVIQTGEDEMDEPLYSVEFADDVLNPVLDEVEAAGVGVPIEPDSDTLIPEEFKPVDGTAGLFTYSPTEDEVYYFTYCVFTNGEGKFYPADENGVVVPGVLPVTLDAEGNILVILNVDGEIIYTSVVDSGLAEDPAVEDEIAIDDEPVIDSENTTKDNEKPDSKQDNKPAATQKPESKPDSGSVSGSDPEPEDDDSQQGDAPTPPQPEPTPDTSTVEDEDDEIIVDPYADCTLVCRTVCNTCGADITGEDKQLAHGKWHMIERDENFSYRSQYGYKFPDGHIEWFG